jgi:two-component system LytT family sensor kinase
MSAAVLVNVVGFFLGAVLYGMLLAMALGAGVPAAAEAWAARWRSPASRLMILTGLLGLLWNLGALTAYGFSPTLQDSALRLPLVIAFTALGFLPAVVVHSVLTRRSSPASSRSARMTIASAYALSGVAAVMHVRSAWLDQPLPSPAALSVLTAGFAVLMLALLVTTRRHGHEGRAIWVVALSVFAVSAVHLAQHTGAESWWTEVLGHHASLLLALAILNRDYRFALADIFLKRALTLTLLLAVVSTVHLTVGLPWLAERSSDPTGAHLTAYVLALALLTAALQTMMRRASAWFVDTVLLRRPDYERLPSHIATAIAQHDRADDVFKVVSTQLVEALDATWVRVAQLEADPLFDLHGEIVRVGVEADVLARRTVNRDANADDRSVDIDPDASPTAATAAAAASPLSLTPLAALLVPTVEAPRFVFLIGQLLGGRRLLSDDLSLLESIALTTARRLDALRVAHERLEATVREQQISRLATEAELRALRAQINPHFLFNALTTVGYLIQTAPDRAMETLLRLTSLLRGVLRRTTNEFSTLGDELDLIEAYLEIEQARFEERLRVTIDVAPALRTLSIPSLLVQPLVENAVKHGIAPSALGGEVIVAAFLELDGGPPHDPRTDQLRISVRDTGVGTTDAALARGRARGVGISSVEHRLRCHFGAAASFHVSSIPDVGTTVDLVVPVQGARKRLPNDTSLIAG